MERRRSGEQKGRDITNAGIYQASTWITGQFPDPAVPKKWLKDRRPDLYAELFPGETGAAASAKPDADANEDPETGLPRANPQEREIGRQGDPGVPESEPEGSRRLLGQRRHDRPAPRLYPMQDQYLGTFITDNVYTLQSQMTTYPGDVWQLAEEQVLEPLVYTDRVEITDPEGHESVGRHHAGHG